MQFKKSNTKLNYFYAISFDLNVTQYYLAVFDFWILINISLINEQSIRAIQHSSNCLKTKKPQRRNKIYVPSTIGKDDFESFLGFEEAQKMTSNHFF